MAYLCAQYDHHVDTSNIIRKPQGRKVSSNIVCEYLDGPFNVTANYFHLIYYEFSFIIIKTLTITMKPKFPSMETILIHNNLLLTGCGLLTVNR